ncbi:MAG: GNAT family N-acetyltransferase [Thermoanaerobaculia bacterium]
MALTTRFLTEGDFSSIHRAWLEGFGDYAVRLELSEEQLREMIRRRGYVPEASAGVFEGTRLVAFTLNGLGTWSGRPTAYDTGTAVVPEYRRRGLGREMMQALIPQLRSCGTQTYLLEVLEENRGAVALYEREGFAVSRRLRCFTLDHSALKSGPHGSHVELREARTDWDAFAAFWDWQPSWQNSIASISRSRAIHRTIAAYAGPSCVGYAVFFPETQDLAQIAVARDSRHRGVGMKLLTAAIEAVPGGRPLRILNIDGSATGVLDFFARAGAKPLVDQLEMTRQL